MNEQGTPTPEALHARDAAQMALHERAAESAKQRFGPNIFVRAVVEVSNFCRENCAYCGMRRSNRNLKRFRLHHEQLAELLIHHRPSSVTDVNIQDGEDPVAVHEVVLPLIRSLRHSTRLGISVCLGNLSNDVYAELKAAGASLYIIKFETANAARFSEMESPGSLAKRLDRIRHLASNGWRVSSGFIAGLPGETEADLI